jgi:hypothetical protein
MRNKLFFFRFGTEETHRLSLYPINQERQLVITNDQLKTILPTKWKLLDDYTVLAPSLPEKDWFTFRLEAAKMDLFDTVFD